MTEVKRVRLVRHGQTDWNVGGRWQGSLPIALNAEGFSQARLLADYLREQPIGAIFTSDLPRAVETATVLGNTFGLEPKIDGRWREFNMGIFQGNTREEIKERFPNEWQAFNEIYWDYTMPYGESRRAFQTRVYSAWEEMIHTADVSEVVAVSHGGSIKMLLLKLFPDVVELHNPLLDNTSVTTLERNGNSWRWIEVGGVKHLKRPALNGLGEANSL